MKKNIFIVVLVFMNILFLVYALAQRAEAMKQGELALKNLVKASQEIEMRKMVEARSISLLKECQKK
jgi:regulatory protein YycI of two-component signal transduction system YycFG